MTKEDLIGKGYKFLGKEHDLFYHSNGFYQKKFTDEIGIKYFITCYEYENDIEVRLVFEKEKYSVGVLLYCINNMTLDEIEKESEDIWQKMGSPYYEIWEDNLND